MAIRIAGFKVNGLQLDGRIGQRGQSADQQEIFLWFVWWSGQSFFLTPITFTSAYDSRTSDLLIYSVSGYHGLV
jgi:hypothetical protein